MNNLQYLYCTDLLSLSSTDYKVLVQQCYCVSSSKGAKGLAKDIIRTFPYADFYSERTKNSKSGTIQMKGSPHGRWICAFYAQVHPGSSGKKNDTSEDREKYFQECLDALSNVKNLKSVAFPQNIGCGLAGGSWESYEEMIKNFATSNPTIQVCIVSPNKNAAREDSNLFINWVCTQIKKDPSRLEKVPKWLANLKLEYKEWLKNPEEDSPTEEVPLDEEPFPASPSSLHTPPCSLLHSIEWQNLSLEEYIEANIPPGWEEFFENQMDLELGTIHGISKFLQSEKQKGEIFPPLDLVFNIFNILQPKDIKVVIIGQDPYHDVGQAMGISFSVPDDIEVPSSLRNIYKEMRDDGFKINDPLKGNLMKWCEQGVFLINTALTVKAHEPKTHTEKWKLFTQALFRHLNSNCDPLVIIMWGNPAQSFSSYFAERHRRIMSSHPSGLSCHKGFFGSRPFSKANKFLISLGKEPIDWSL